ncbi:MAG: hypothetical protein ACJAQ3_001650 [Planctomycetota bacterium]|jgi:hypothetical protein
MLYALGLVLSLPMTPLSTAACFLPQDDAAVRLEAAGSDVDALCALARSWVEEEADDSAVRAWTQVLSLDSKHEEAHLGLRHHRHGTVWFETYAELAKARRAEAKRRFESEGVVPFGDEWVPAADLPFRRMGWESLEGGTWGPPGTRERMAGEAKKRADGWEQQHASWVAPSEFDAWRSGLWKVGEQWLDTAAANQAHSKIGAWWQIPGDHFTALTTLSEDDSRWVHWWADQAAVDLERIFGLAPQGKPDLVVLNGIAQYNDFAAGSAAEARVPADASGHSSLHYAFFTDGWTEVVEGRPIFRGTGAAYYDVQDPALKPFGQHAIRHAAALAWLESVDPSWDAVSRLLTQPGSTFPDQWFWKEKRIPRWLRYGAAAYCERFFEDRKVGDDGDALWARKWAVANLKTDGEFSSLEDIFAMDMNTAAPEASLRRIHEAGWVVHFLLEGSDRKVQKAWSAYREALVAGEEVEEHVKVLEAALLKAKGRIASLE